ncbi:MAG: hypothetical protein IT236_07595 [Bacteroidia bacterium]|nr:hypothetical protein [Bacteroidia bacterium]
MSDQQNTPYLSIVVASRNDNHGGDMLKRMRVFMRALIHQCNKFKLPCELILVEWNPIPGEKLLHEILPPVNTGDYLTVRYVQVPPELHYQLAFSKQIPLFQMIAKNVGIRRAKAEFVLCTNVDIIFSDEIFARLAKRDLQQNCFYRANRCDVPNTINEHDSVDTQLKFCAVNIKKRLGKNAYYANFADTTGFMFKYPFFLPLLKFLSKVKARYANTLNDRLNELDLDACGDFTLMSKNDWIKIQAYPELEIYSIHIDSMGILAAAALNMKQVIFAGEECTYHMEHTGGWEFSNPIDKIHFYTKKPMLDWWTVREAGLHLMQHGSTFNLNKKNWGLEDVSLEEISGNGSTI